MERWARYLIRRRRRVLIAWAVLFLVAAAFTPRFQSVVQGVGFEIPGSESERATDVFGDTAGYAERTQLVVTAERPVGAARLKAALGVIGPEIAREDGVVRVEAPPAAAGVGSPTISSDGTTAFSSVLLGPGIDDRQALAEDLQKLVDEHEPPGFTADLTGTSPLLHDLIKVEESDLAKGEGIGLPIALVIMFVAFGSLVAAGMPLLLALTALTICLGMLGMASFFTDWYAYVQNIVAMIGIGLGIDYALLIMRRYREERERGDGDDAAMVRALNTAGRTVIFSGSTVMVCLPSFFIMREPLYSQIAVATMLVVALMVVAAVSLLPAAVLALGDRIDRLRLPRRGGAAREGRSGLWHAWAHRVMRRPVLYLGAGVAFLLVLASPNLGMKLGVDYGARSLIGEPSGRGLATLEEKFPAATLAPLEVAVRADGDAAAIAAAGRAQLRLDADPRIGDIQVLGVRDGTALLAAQPLVAVDSEASEAMVEDLRDDLPAAVGRAEVLVGGTPAESVDYTERMREAAPFVVGAVLLVSFLLLMWIFRSIVLPLKALVANLLSVGAAMGLVVLLFQDGHGEGIFDFTGPDYLQAYMPLTVFVLVFGLSMDYEVFLVSRMREEWLRTHDNTAAVAAGLERTGGVVTSAAAIMVAVFGAFVLATVPEIKQLGFGLAAAVLIDATIVRALIVPAFMRIAGKWNWWLPRPLERILPGSPMQ